MAVEKVLLPVATVNGVGRLDVKTHDCGEDLGEEENREAGEKGGRV